MFNIYYVIIFYPFTTINFKSISEKKTWSFALCIFMYININSYLRILHFTSQCLHYSVHLISTYSRALHITRYSITEWLELAKSQLAKRLHGKMLVHILSTPSPKSHVFLRNGGVLSRVCCNRVKPRWYPA